jgi:hypothetical protein
VARDEIFEFYETHNFASMMYDFALGDDDRRQLNWFSETYDKYIGDEIDELYADYEEFEQEVSDSMQGYVNNTLDGHLVPLVVLFSKFVQV